MVEVGGANYNGNIASAFTWSQYVAIDLVAGPGVTVVADFTIWAAKQAECSFDLVIAMEVLEHTSLWPEMVAASYRLLEVGGLFLGTCATGARSPHGATGAPHPAPGEWYRNLSVGELADALAAAGFTEYTLDVTRSALDLRWAATRT